MVSGEHEHRGWVEAGDAHTLYLPIAPVRLGEVKVLVQASLPDRKIQKEVKILVEVRKKRRRRRRICMIGE